MSRRPGRLPFGAVAVLALCACSAGRDGADVRCRGSAALALVGGVVIGWHDVRLLQGEVRLAGGEQSDRDALIDVLWQELARQKRGLPGGTEIHRSRRRIVREYRNAGYGPQANRSEFVPGQTPHQAILTDCGKSVLAGAQ